MRLRANTKVVVSDSREGHLINSLLVLCHRRKERRTPLVKIRCASGVWDTYVALVVRAVQVHAVPARGEEYLGAETEAWLRRKAVVLSRGRLLQAHVGNSELGEIRAIESSV